MNYLNLINGTLRVLHHSRSKEPNKSHDGIDSGSITINVLKDLEFFSNFSSNLTVRRWDDASGDIFLNDVIPTFCRGQADLAVSYYYLIVNRLASSMPLHPILNERFWAFFRQPHFTSVRNIYVEPFSQELRIAVVLLTTLFVASISITLKILNAYNLRQSLRESLWHVVAFICLKGYNLKLRQPTFRILCLICAMFFSLLFATYSAFLTSVLTRNPTPINSIPDLVYYGFTFFSLPHIHKSILKPEWPKSSFLETHTKIGTVASELESFKLAVDGGHVHVDGLDGFIRNAGRLKIAPDKLCYKVAQLPFPDRSNQMLGGFFVPKNSTVRGKLNISILRLRDGGLLHRYNNIYARHQYFICPEVKGKYQKNLGLSHVLTAFLIFLCSIPLSILILLTEKYFYKK